MRYTVVLAIFILLAGCEDNNSPAVQTQPGNTLTQSGVVTEMIEVENYTFIRLESNGSEAWIATLPVWVSKGDVVEFSDAAVMTDFYSESLDRTFPTILFVQDVKIINAAEQVSEAHETLRNEKSDALTVTSVPVGEVKPLEGGMTIAEIFSAYPQLNDQTINMRARVVKFSANIMSLNWVTLQDGSGAAPGDKLVATTSETVTPGDLVIATGTIRNDVSLGYGYDYKMLLEDTRFQQENND